MQNKAGWSGNKKLFRSPALAPEGAGDVLHVSDAVAGYVQGLVAVDLSESR